MSFGSLVRTAYCGAGFGTNRTGRVLKLVEKKAGAFGGKLVNSPGDTNPGTAGSPMKQWERFKGPMLDIDSVKADSGVRAYEVRRNP